LPVTTVAPLPALQKAVQPMLGYKEQSRFEYSSRSAFKHYEIAFEKQLPMASKCPRLDPYKHSSPHYKSDLTCEQGLPGWSKDADCMCEYPVAARDAKGCPTGFYTLCYRGPFGSNALPEDGVCY
uniref:Cpw-wpc domain-containing protein n=2 Tax=Gongylonema pulchrum TaxID=637853 RepID=A0A183ERE1_9BILA